MRKLTQKSRVLLMGALLSIVSLTLFSCVWWLRIDCPEVVETDSTFEVRLVIDDLYSRDQAHNHYDCWGYLGVQLPVGWTINEDDVVYECYPKQGRSENDGHKNFEYHTGTMVYDEGYVTMCCEPEFTEDGNYWTGFSTLQKESECMDSIVVKVTIHTDGQLGDKFLVFTLQENGDENVPWGDEITKKPIYPVDHGTEDKPKKAARTAGDPSDNGEGATRYAEISVKQKAGIEAVTIDKNDASYNVVTLGAGQLQVNLSDSRKIGATAMVYNMKGQIVANEALNQTSNVINGLTPGVYSVAIQKDGIRSLKKVIVK